MARTIEITLPHKRTGQILQLLSGTTGVLNLRVEAGISLEPPGDVITAETTTRSLASVIAALHHEGIGADGTSLTTREPASVVSLRHNTEITTDSGEATWEEMDYSINKQSRMSLNGLLVMAASGMIATIGLASGALHLVTGAKLIAPGFEVLAHIGLGAANQSRAWMRGVVDTSKAYAALILGAIVMTLILEAIGKSPLQGNVTYLPATSLIAYWTTLHSTTILSSAAGSIAGAVLIAANRGLLTAGVMVVMALVPSAASIGIGLASGHLGIARGGFFLWISDAALVVVLSCVVFGWKRLVSHRRKSLE
ncbi:MAG TPA: DUF389 domain-containing protein [Verrucomicrobiae bacterium]|nr:DUF389 domain-containing protein [Verrucomicrobiae bacterium]